MITINLTYIRSIGKKIRSGENKYHSRLPRPGRATPDISLCILSMSYLCVCIFFFFKGNYMYILTYQTFLLLVNI